MASRTSSSKAGRDTGGSARGALLAGLASVLTLPVAVYLTRFSDAYELLHAGFAIPIGLVLGVVALRLAGRTRRRGLVTLSPPDHDRVATAARVLGGLGVCLALAGVVALAVYGLLEYAGTR
jgi:NhaP-type Na+/H+ or K+/H+ antiporter